METTFAMAGAGEQGPRRPAATRCGWIIGLASLALATACG